MGSNFHSKVKWICIETNEEKGYFKGKICTITSFSIDYEMPYDTSPFDDNFKSPPFCPQKVSLGDIMIDENFIQYTVADLGKYFKTLKDYRKDIIKKLLK